MGILYYQDKKFKERLSEKLKDDFARKATAAAQDRFNERRDACAKAMPQWQDLRNQAAAIRAHVLDHLDVYLDQFIDQATANGMRVHFAKDAQVAAQTLLQIAKEKQASCAVKSKSMVSEEVGTNAALLSAGIEVNETDLGEWILQLDDWEPPSHIIAPAIHKDRKRIFELFCQNGYTGTIDVAEMTNFARQTLREKFLTADIGITGCNFAVASTGSVFLMTNEGNGRMTTTLPKTQVVMMGMERLVPTLADLDAILQLFARSAVGTKISSYLSMTNGPRQADELDGPEEVHVIIIDNGRSKILKSEFKDMLRCIRCGTCQNVCPVYRQATVHSYGSIYEGPMGIVLTPLLTSYEEAGELAYASTLCGECSDHCPVKIPLHELILKHRIKMVEEGHTNQMEDRIYQAAGVVLGSHHLYEGSTLLGRLPMEVVAKLNKHEGIDDTLKLPVLKEWTRSRNLPVLKSLKLRRWWRKHQRGGCERG